MPTGVTELFVVELRRAGSSDFEVRFREIHVQPGGATNLRTSIYLANGPAMTRMATPDSESNCSANR